MDLVASHFLPGLDWLVKLGIGVIVATAGVLLFRQPRRGGLGFALGLFIAETGTLVAIRALVAAGTSSRWQYIMPFGLVLVPALFVAFILTRLRWWERAGFTWPGKWRAPHLAVLLVAALALPILGLSSRGIMPDNFFLPGADELGVVYQMFEAALIGILFTAARLRMNTIGPVIAIHAAYDFILILAFGHASPVAPTLPGFLVDTAVNLGLAGFGLFLIRPRHLGRVVPMEQVA